MGEHIELPQVWRWSVAGRRLPIEATMPLAIAVRAALNLAARRNGDQRLPDAFHGGRGAGPGHTHAFWLPEDEDCDGEIDHLLLFCESGIPARIVALLAGLSRLSDSAAGDVTLVPDRMGRHGPGGLFGPARIWRGVTPYVTPRWRGKPGRQPRERDRPEEQLLAEIAARGWPEPATMSFRPSAWAGDRLALAPSFALVRPERTPPGDAVATFADLSFDGPVWGPMAFGYCAHFGLGLMAPQDE